MNLPLYWVDAFTRQVFGGNPAAVVPLAEWLPDTVLQRIAFENGLSETAFFVRTEPARFRLRWFTPRVEVDLCGHATLASAHVLFAVIGQSGDRVVFDTRSGPLEAARAVDGRIELNFPARPPVAHGADAKVPALLAGLGKQPESLYLGRGSTNYLAVYTSASEVRALKPDFAALAALGNVRVIVTAPGEDCDFVSRFFAAGVGIPEDPVTGSAHCTLVPYWAERLGRRTLHARQVSERGGELFCELAGDRVKIAGYGVLYLSGKIEL
jgi:PhzF family phenazine biosynthesis protein